MTPEERAEILVTARLLRAAGTLRWLAVALIAVATAAMIFVHSLRFGVVSIAIGLVAIYYGVRVSFDARLLEDIANQRLSTAALDAALGRFAKTERPWSERCRGAKRLARWLAIATIAQTLAVVMIGFW